jgi:hypothetical protein
MKGFWLPAALLACLLVLGAARPVLAADDVDVALGRIERILDDVEQIKRVMDDRPKEVEVYRKRLHSREADLERERIAAMSRAAHVSPRVVERMRADGMGWGAIAHELRVSPFIVGVAEGHGGYHDFRRGRDHDDDQRFEDWRGQHKGWKNGMPPGQAKKHRGD